MNTITDERLAELVRDHDDISSCSYLGVTLPNLSRDTLDALRELQQRREVEQWRPIETAPKDGTEFQAWMHSAFLTTGWWEPRCRFNDDGAFQVWQRVDYDDDGFDTVHATPTRWMPYPSPPLAAGEMGQEDGK